MEMTVTHYEHLLNEGEHLDNLCKLAYALNMRSGELILESTTYTHSVSSVADECAQIQRITGNTLTAAEEEFIKRVWAHPITLTKDDRARLISLNFDECADDMFINYFLPIGVSLSQINTEAPNVPNVVVRATLRKLFGKDGDCLLGPLIALYGEDKISRTLLAFSTAAMTEGAPHFDTKVVTDFTKSVQFCMQAFTKKPSMTTGELERFVADCLKKGITTEGAILNLIQ